MRQDIPKLTVIGLDAATFDVIDPMLEAGELPNLAKIFASGSRGVLHSTVHPLTTQAWTTMLTGVNAGRHGMWDFIERDASGYRLRLVNGSYRKAPAVWERLSRSGRRVGIVNVPFTWPAQKVNGFMVAGLDASAREEGMTHPPELLQEMKSRHHTLEFDHAMPIAESGEVDLDQVRRVCEQRVETVRALVDRFDPELLFVVFMAADHIHHLCWPEWDAEGTKSRVADVYRILDEAVGSLAELGGPDRNMMVVSDHGGGLLKGVVNLNAWLAEGGFLNYTEGRRKLGVRQLARAALHRVLQLRSKLPRRTRNFFKQRFPRLVERSFELREFTSIDWAKTRAFAYGIFGNVVINVRGRELTGIVQPGEEYDHVRDEIAEKALELCHPDTGERLVARVHRREDLFDGPYLEKIPDLIVEFDEYAWLGKGNLKGRTPTIWDEIPLGAGHSYAGSHRREGIVALAGPSAARGNVIDGGVIDVAPTILYLLGESVPLDLEGRILQEAIDPVLLDERSPEYSEEEVSSVGEVHRYSEDDVAAVEGRLRNLGYLE